MKKSFTSFIFLICFSLALSFLLFVCTVRVYSEADIFMNLIRDTTSEAFDTQAIPAIENGIAAYWYPKYLATVIIAVDRGKTDAEINGWHDLAALEEQIGMTSKGPYLSHILAAVSYSFEGDEFSLHTAARFLSPIYKQERLVFDNYDLPILICFDYQAANMIKSGRNIEIIIPCEGTLTFEKGLLSNNPLDVSDSPDILIDTGFRLIDGSCDKKLYPPTDTYKHAVILSDYTHINTQMQDTTKILRREIQNIRLYTSADSHEHQIFALLFIIITIIWVGFIAYRAMQRGVRRSTFVCSSLIVCWTVIRIFKFNLIEEDVLNRYAWYSYYIFQLGIPLTILFTSIVIDKTKDISTKWWFYAAGINIMLIILVLTNDFHQLVFIFDKGSTDWSKNYSYRSVYFIIAFVAFLEVLLSQIIMVLKSWNSPKKLAFVFPLAIYLFMGIFCVCYALRIPVAWESDITIIIGIFVLLFMEACIQIGFMPVNRKYRQFFTHSPHNMQIINNSGDMVLTSVQARAIEKSMWHRFCENPDVPQAASENELLYSSHINGGMIIWQEDISSLNRLHREIEVSLEHLRMTNALLENEELIYSNLASSRAREQLFSALENKIRYLTEKLSHMLHNIPKDIGRGAYIARVALLVCYIKRRCHLFFLEQNSSYTEATELAVYMDELAEFAKGIGLNCFCNCIISSRVLLRSATLMYDLFYSLINSLKEHENISLFLQIIREDDLVVMRVMPSGDMTFFNPDTRLISEIELAGGSFFRRPLPDADGFWLTFSDNQEQEGGGSND